MVFYRKYNTGTHIYVPIPKRGVADFAVGADWTPAAGDVKVSKDGGAAANIGTLPTAITMGNTAVWDFTIAAGEVQGAKIIITISDSATKAVEDQCLIIETYGNASAELKMDWSDSVRMGLTALPNAAAEAAGGLYTRGTGAGQINQPANGQIDAKSVDVLSAAANIMADALLDRANAVETGLTFRQALRLIAAAEAGKLSGAATTTIIIRNAIADSKDRITATVDASGNRSAITVDLT